MQTENRHVDMVGGGESRPDIYTLPYVGQIGRGKLCNTVTGSSAQGSLRTCRGGTGAGGVGRRLRGAVYVFT